jgi:hypothetical protein
MENNVEIVDAFTENEERPRTIYTVRVGKHRYADVMRYVDDNGRQSVYIMQCADGNVVYDYDGNTYSGRVYGEKEILEKALTLPAGTLPKAL